MGFHCNSLAISACLSTVLFHIRLPIVFKTVFIPFVTIHIDIFAVVSSSSAASPSGAASSTTSSAGRWPLAQIAGEFTIFSHIPLPGCNITVTLFSTISARTRIVIASICLPWALRKDGCSASIHQIDLFNVNFRKSRCLSNDFLVVGILGFYSHSAWAESLFIIMHHRAVIILCPSRINILRWLLVEIVFCSTGDIVFQDGDPAVPVWSRLFMMESNRMSDFMDDSVLSPASFT